MADNLVGQGFDQYVGTRQVAGQQQTEFYNKQSNQGYGTAQDLATAVAPYAQNVNAQNVFDILKTGIAPSATVPVPSTVPTAAVTNAPSNYDVQSVMDATENCAIRYSNTPRRRLMKSPARTNLGTANNTLKNFDVSVEGRYSEHYEKARRA